MAVNRRRHQRLELRVLSNNAGGRTPSTTDDDTDDTKLHGTAPIVT
jgi:hypothetical protein